MLKLITKLHHQVSFWYTNEVPSRTGNNPGLIAEGKVKIDGFSVWKCHLSVLISRQKLF